MAGDSSVSASLEPLSSPRKRPKIHPETSPISPSSKGKAPIVELSAASELDCNDGGDGCLEPQQCGICLSEEGHAVRGCIDSCDHYFCFLCIIEWSKIESRCPLCKRRFSSICRMRRDGSFISDRAVVVPVRNQVYDLHGNMTTGPLDPYANISCSICAGSTDENLLLLCDLCDTAVHTYCAGLGATVPEGDWFCQECAQMKAEDVNGKPDTDLGSSHTSDQFNTETSLVQAPTSIPSVQAPTSIYDIVREPSKADPEVDRLLTLFSPHQKPSASANALPHQAHRNVDGAYEGSRVSKKSKIEVTESSVRTLPRCRDAHKRVEALRENWHGLRSGSLGFPSGKFNSGARNNLTGNDTNGGYGSSELRSLSSENSVQPTRQHGSMGEDTPDNYDVDRAWKMFDIAKSMKQPQKLSCTSSLTSKNPSPEGSAAKDSKNLFLGAPKSVTSRTKTITFTGSKMHESFKKPEGCESKRSEHHNNGIRLGGEKTSTNYTGLAAASLGNYTSNNNTQKPVQTAVFHRKSVMLSQEKPGQGLRYVYHQHDVSTCTTSLAGSLTGASGVPLAGSKMHQSFKKPEGYETKRSEQHNNGIRLGRENTSINCTGLAAASPGNITSNNNTQKSVQTDVFHGKAVMLSKENPGQELAYVYHQQDVSTHTTSLAGSLTGASGVPYSKLQIKPASLSGEVCSDRNIDAKNTGENKDCGQLLKSAGKRGSAESISSESKRIKCDDAKSEIQSLVKLNLKLLTVGKKLEVDKFKDIARRSTHEILAACGLEPRRLVKLRIPEWICSHKDQLQQRRKSLMPSCCSECFYVFVKDVVSSNLSEKTSH